MNVETEEKLVMSILLRFEIRQRKKRMMAVVGNFESIFSRYITFRLDIRQGQIVMPSRVSIHGVPVTTVGPYPFDHDFSIIIYTNTLLSIYFC